MMRHNSFNPLNKVVKVAAQAAVEKVARQNGGAPASATISTPLTTVGPDGITVTTAICDFDVTDDPHAVTE